MDEIKLQIVVMLFVPIVALELMAMLVAAFGRFSSFVGRRLDGCRSRQTARSLPALPGVLLQGIHERENG